ncbi:MAG: hypothetical protein IBX55_21770 [Methyloprofundus sp.]|nr:hypothetical protein [Methyloprofundus sp.]
MTGKLKTPAEIKQALVLRQAGYSLATIAQKTGISIPTLARHFKKHGAVKGTLPADAVEQAKRQLLEDAGFLGEIKHQIAAAIADDISQFIQIRQATALTLSELMTNSAMPAHYRARGIAAVATTLRLSQELAHKALSVDDLQPEPESLPELIVSELTTQEIAQMRKDQEELSIKLGEVVEEIEIIDEGLESSPEDNSLNAPR